MKISDALVEKLILNAKITTKEKLNKLREEATAEKSSLQAMVIKNELIDEKGLVKLYSEEAEVPFIDLNPK